jgi:hypothetical protein
VEFEEKGPWALSIKYLEPNKAAFGPLKVSGNMFMRLPLEFLNLNWFLNEIAYRAHAFPEVARSSVASLDTVS